MVRRKLRYHIWSSGYVGRSPAAIFLPECENQKCKGRPQPSPENTIDVHCRQDENAPRGGHNLMGPSRRVLLHYGRINNKMSENDVIANQKRILKNQKEIIANQMQIKSNQETIKKNQATILKNQSSLNTILKNQKRILALLHK